MNDDWRLLELAHGGDETAWGDLFRHHYAPLVRIAACVTGSIETAHDLAQESFVRLLRTTVKHHEGTVGSLLATIAYRLALKERKRRNAHRSVEEGEVADDSPSPLESVIRDETDRCIFRAMQSLTVEHREILALRFFGGYSYEEIADIAGIPVGTVKSRIFHATKECREKLIHLGVLQ